MRLVTTILFLSLFVCNTASAQNFTNKGKEFWVGYGHNHLFNYSAALNQQTMVLYLSAEQAATVTVSVNGTSWTRTYVIPANTVVPTDSIPKSGPSDARILAEGINKHAIHIVSDVPIVAFAHTYGTYSSGGTMLIPVESYSYSYFSINSEQSYGDGSYSWFYIIASENNTKVTITPVKPTAGGKAAAVAFTVTLQKGEMYNVMGALQTTGLSYDMSGSKIQSVPGDDGICHPIAVFSGSSRTSICINTLAFTDSGSDFSMNQVFPTTAWGSTYVLALTSSSDGAAILNNNRVRIYLRDKTTQVKVNGNVLTGLTNNFFYDYLATTSDIITANKPIMVAQFIPSGYGCGSSGDGDPEMLYISPVDQAIKSSYWYNTNLQSISTNFVTLVIPNGGLPTLKIDGSNKFDYTYPHPNAPGYTVVVKKLPLTPGQHNAQSDTAFTAVTYGLGHVESYGYNAGTYIKNLEATVQVKNEFGVTANTTTCVGTTFGLRLKSTYRPSSIIWKLSAVNGLKPNVDITQPNPIPVDSVTENNRKYLIYLLPGNYNFPTAGTYNVPVSITDASIENCSFSVDIIVPVDVIAAPKVDFSTSTNNCAKDSIVFNGIAPDAVATNKWLWTFGNGAIDSIQQPKKPYLTAGNYNVNLKIVRAKDGCTNDTTKPITIKPLPIAKFTVPQNVCMPNGTAVFTNQSTYPAGITDSLTYAWNFGDGGTSTKKNPTYNYPAIATYLVTLKAITKDGCFDTSSQQLSSFANKPVANFTTSTALCAGSLVTFTDKSTGNDTAWFWKSGNGDTSIKQAPQFTYPNAGIFTATLITTASNGCASDTFKQTFTIKPAVMADFTTSKATCQSDSVSFVDASLNANAPLKWLWNFGDSSIDSISNPKKAFALAGTYNVKLHLTTLADGCTGDTVKSIQINPLPVSAFTLPANICMPNGTATFTNQSTSQGGAADSLTYIWNFGDGGTSTQKNPTYNYPAIATYLITLKAVTKYGCFDISSQQLSSFANKPVANFTISTALCAGSLVTFTDKSTGNDTAWLFNAGNGASSTKQTPQFSYAQAGQFTAYLITTASNGCASDTAKQTFTIKPAVMANFTATKTACQSDSALFVDASLNASAPLKWLWNFGDGSIDSISNPKKAFALAGTYNVKLHLTTLADGCTGDTIKSIQINPLPISAFTLPANVCMPNGDAAFTNSSTLPNGNLNQLTYNWDFGDGGTSIVKNPTHGYATIGAYTVLLKATSQDGCTNISSQIFSAFSNKPVANFTQPKTLCAGTTVVLVDNSIGNITAWQWGSGNGLAANQAVAKFVYPQAGAYNPYLIVTDAKGCTSDTAKQTITIYDTPQVDAGPSFTIHSGATAILHGSTSNPNLPVQWSPSIYLDNATILSPTSATPATQIYTLTVTGPGNCTASDTTSVRLIQAIRIPTAFSPNGDGLNDVWNIPYLDSYPQASLQIFNRWGQLVYTQSSNPKPWNGNLNGSPLPVGTYYYIIDTKDGPNSRYNGIVTLLR